jgi:hypothetical protein
MKHLIISLLIVISLISCKKDTIDPIEYDSEIFFGKDTLIYGEWKYIHSSGGFTGNSQIDRGISLLSIKPIGDFASISKDNNIIKGKIMIEGQMYNRTQIQFLRDGIRSFGVYQTIEFNGSDTLILLDPCCDNYSDYYKRIK